MRHYCTYFDRNYIHRGLSLFLSLIRHENKDFKFWVLCLDDETFAALQKLSWANIVPIRLVDLEKYQPKLLEAKANRSVVEYYWTLTPTWILYILEQKQPELVVYLDADMFALGHPEVLQEVLGQGSILITTHDYSEAYRGQESSGKFNVGLLIFRNDNLALKCLQWWSERCIEWCYARKEGGKFGDQGYLNDWPERFEGVIVNSHSGLGLAPWNICKYPLKLHEGTLSCNNGQPAIFYHFHGFNFCTKRLVWIASWNIGLDNLHKDLLYRPYINEMMGVETVLSNIRMRIPIPRIGVPWRYLVGRIIRRQPLAYFLLVPRTRNQELSES